MQQPLLTINEVATILKVSEITIYRIAGKKITGIKIGRSWRFTEDAVNDYLDSRTIKSVKKKQASI